MGLRARLTRSHVTARFFVLCLPRLSAKMPLSAWPKHQFSQHEKWSNSIQKSGQETMFAQKRVCTDVKRTSFGQKVSKIDYELALESWLGRWGLRTMRIIGQNLLVSILFNYCWTQRQTCSATTHASDHWFVLNQRLQKLFWAPQGRLFKIAVWARLPERCKLADGSVMYNEEVMLRG